MREGLRREVWVIESGRHDIWGLSASILVDLAQRVMAVPPLVVDVTNGRGGTG